MGITLHTFTCISSSIAIWSINKVSNYGIFSVISILSYSKTNGCIEYNNDMELSSIALGTPNIL